MLRMVSKVEIARYVMECMRREDTPRASELAAQCGVTASHLSRTFRARYGVAGEHQHQHQHD